MSDDKKIQDIFKQTSLENEDWLEPSSTVFQSIEDVIYKKKRKWLWLWLITLLVALALLVYWQFPKNKLSGSTGNNIKATEPINNIPTDKNKPLEQTGIYDTNQLNNTNKFDLVDAEVQASSEITTTSSSETLKDDGLNKSTITKSNMVEEDINSTTESSSSTEEEIAINVIDRKIKQSSKVSDNNTSFKKDTSKPNRVKGFLNSNVSNIIDLKEANIQPVSNSKKIIAKNKNTDLSNEQYVDLVKEPVSLKKSVVNNEAIEKLPSIILNFLSNSNEGLTIPSQKNIIPDLFNQPKTNWSLGVISGFSYWDYSLNNNYKKALKPAKFKYTNSKGYFVAIEAVRVLNEKFSIAGNIGFETVCNKSGHNSTIEYNPVNENDESASTYNLKMASTLGFIDANIEIQRQNDVYVDASPIIVNLNNQHKINSVDFSAYLSFNALNFNRTNASAHIGLGVAQIINVRNKLTSFTTSIPALNPYKKQILVNQTEFNKTRPFVAFGSSFTHQLNTVSNLFLTYTFKSDFNKLYQSDDFSTFLSKHNIGLGYQKQF